MKYKGNGALDWLIVGGGIHGVHVAARLVGQVGVPRSRLAIVDPGEGLLATWRRRAARTGMRHLRSPAVHHVGLSPYSLRQFPSRNPWLGNEPFAAPYDRPSVELFDAHSDWVLDNYGLDTCHVRDRVSAIELAGGPATVRTDGGLSLRARHLVLAMGPPPPSRPSWAPPAEPRVQHIFADDLHWPDQPERVVVIGGGITGAQVSQRLAAEGHDVTLVSRHGFRVKQFDSEPGWLGPRFMRAFDKLTCHNQRRNEIAQARHRGSMPHDVHRALKAALETGAVALRQADVASFGSSPDLLALALDDGGLIEADRVILATGFEARRPGGAVIDDLVQRAGLPCADCGFPIVDRSLRWHPRVFVTGPLAELELGPTSRNIAGARAAGDRIAKVAARWHAVGLSSESQPACVLR